MDENANRVKDGQSDDPIDREAERERVWGSDPAADPVSGPAGDAAPGGNPAAGVGGEHKIRASQNEVTADVPGQRRAVVEASIGAPDRYDVGFQGDRLDEVKRRGANTDGAYDPLTDAQRASADMPDERTAQPAAGAIEAAPDDYGGTTNSGDKAAPDNRLPSLDLDEQG